MSVNNSVKTAWGSDVAAADGNTNTTTAAPAPAPAAAQSSSSPIPPASSRSNDATPLPPASMERRPSLAHLVVVRPTQQQQQLTPSPGGPASMPASASPSGTVFVHPYGSPSSSNPSTPLFPTGLPAFVPAAAAAYANTAASPGSPAANGYVAVSHRRSSFGSQRQSSFGSAVMPASPMASMVPGVPVPAWNGVPDAVLPLTPAPPPAMPATPAAGPTTVFVSPVHAGTMAAPMEGVVYAPAPAAAAPMPLSPTLVMVGATQGATQFTLPASASSAAAAAAAAAAAIPAPLVGPATSTPAPASAGGMRNKRALSRQGTITSTVLPMPISSNPGPAKPAWNDTPEALRARPPSTPASGAMEEEEADAMPEVRSPATLSAFNFAFPAEAANNSTPTPMAHHHHSDTVSSETAALERAVLRRQATLTPQRAWVQQHPYAHNPNANKRRSSMPSLTLAEVRRIDVQDGLQSSFSGRRTSTTLNSPRGTVPSYTSDYPHGRKAICMLHSLSSSLGSFHPRFRPEEFLHILYVPANTFRVTFYPTSGDGKVMVNHRAPHIPVVLTGTSTKAVITVLPESEYMLEGRYTIDVRWGSPPEDSDDDEQSRDRDRDPQSDGVSVGTSASGTRPELYRVFHSFEADDPTKELSLEKGELVRVTNKAGSWWFGCVCDAKGRPLTHFNYFPQSFVRPLVITATSGESSSYPESEEQEEEEKKKKKTAAATDDEQQGGTGLINCGREIALPRLPVRVEMTTQTDNLSEQKKNLQSVEPPPPAFRIFTLAMVTVNLLLLVVALGKGGVQPKDNPMLGPSHSTLQSLGARFTNDVVHGKVYQLLTQMFLPVGILRFLLDAGLYITVVSCLERTCRAVRTGFIFFFSGIVGNLTGSFFVSRWLITGPSSALFGCLGALVCLHVNRAKSKGPLLLSTRDHILISVLVVLAMISGTLPGLDNYSQVGGFVAGYLCCMVFASDMIDHREHLSRDYMVLGLLSSCFLFAAVIVTLFFLVDVNKPCFWCMKATCLPVRDWCDASRLGSGAVDFYTL